MGILNNVSAEQLGRNLKHRWLIVPSFAVLAVGIGLLGALFPVFGIIIAAAVLFLFVAWRKAEWIVYLWLFSSVFYAYRFEVGSVSLNPYRVSFILAVLTLPFQPSWFATFLRRKKQALVLLPMLVLFTLGWVRSPSEFPAVATSDLLLLYSWSGMFLYLLNFVDSEKKLHWVIKAYLLTSSFVAGYGIYEILTWLLTGTVPLLPFAQLADPRLADETARSRVMGYGIPRATSFFNDPNLLGVYLTIAILFLLTYLEKAKSRLRYILLILLILVHAANIAFTVSRSGIFLLGFCLVVPQLKRYRVVGKKWRAKGSIVVIVIGLLSFGMLYFMSPAFSTYVNTFIDAFRYRASRIGDDRIMFMTTGLETFLDSPLVGVGMTHTVHRNTVIAYTAHSFYLTILATYGIVGALIVGVFLWPLLKEAVKTVLQPKPRLFDLCFSLATLVLFAFQIIYDNLFGELVALPFSILYIWALLQKQKLASRTR